MIDIEELFRQKPTLPDWFRTHPIFKEVKQASKIFPSIGLTNFTVESNLENDNAATLIRNLCQGINAYLYDPLYFFEKTNPNNERLGKVAKAKVALAHSLLTQFQQQLGKHKAFITQFPTKRGLYLQADILDTNKKPFARENESVFKAYGKLVAFLTKHYNYNLTALDSIPAFKEYSSNNFDGKLNICFSSDGIDGAWDIATMSMRGIQSCQSWTGQYKNNIIGSVIDPFTGIIYLTSGSKGEHGTKMMRRCVVRFIVDSTIKRPCLFLEYMYPGGHSATMQAFKEALRSKTGDRFPIIEHTDAIGGSRYYVPYSQMTTLCVKHGNAEYANMRGHHNLYGVLPYRDTFMEYRIKEPHDFNDGVVSGYYLDADKAEYLNKIITVFQETNISVIYANIIKDMLVSEVFDKANTAGCNTQKDYKRRIAMFYLANKSKVNAALLIKLKAEMDRNKDKTIIIPGIVKPIKAKSIKTLAKTRVAKTKAVKKKPIADIDVVFAEMIVPIISKVFKDSWRETIKLPKKARAKRQPRPINL